MGPVVALLSMAKMARNRGHILSFAAKRLFIPEILKNCFDVVQELPSRELKPLDETFLQDFAYFQGLGDLKYVEEIIFLSKPQSIFSNQT